MSKDRMRKEIETILSGGRSLADHVGVNNWGLTKAEALTALDALRVKQIAVWGGDVYVLTEKGVEPAYANWSCERLPKEKAADFVERSLQAARSFIAGYPVGKGETLFALVPHDDVLF